jgi:1-acyl-sn-glycerol-3-phosphate acyltransferase
MALLRGIYFWIVLVIMTIVSVGISALLQLGLMAASPLTRQEWGHRAGFLWGRGTYRLMPFWSIKIEGEENLPDNNQPMVMIANHQSASDIWVAYFLKAQFRWLSKKEIFHIPLIGPAMRWAGYIAIERGNATSHRQAMEQAAQVLRNGISMFFFPEGTRTRDGKMQEFKLGAFRLAQDLHVPILPVVMSGTKDLVPKGSAFPGKADVHMKILPAMRFKDFDPELKDLTGFARHVRDIMEKEYDRMNITA